ncbi:MAG: hypothetical protein R3208_03550 [Ketobacteraceae bacterium]|nr:hypothetical protein [Ketobacteraceae bacterium]
MKVVVSIMFVALIILCVLFFFNRTAGKDVDEFHDYVLCGELHDCLKLKIQKKFVVHTELDGEHLKRALIIVRDKAWKKSGVFVDGKLNLEIEVKFLDKKQTVAEEVLGNIGGMDSYELIDEFEYLDTKVDVYKSKIGLEPVSVLHADDYGFQIVMNCPFDNGQFITCKGWFSLSEEVHFTVLFSHQGDFKSASISILDAMPMISKILNVR